MKFKSVFLLNMPNELRNREPETVDLLDSHGNIIGKTTIYYDKNECISEVDETKINMKIPGKQYLEISYVYKKKPAWYGHVDNCNNACTAIDDCWDCPHLTRVEKEMWGRCPICGHLKENCICVDLNDC